MVSISIAPIVDTEAVIAALRNDPVSSTEIVASALSQMKNRIKALEAVNTQLLMLVGESEYEILVAAVTATIEAAAAIADLGKDKGVAAAIRLMPRDRTSLNAVLNAEREKAFKDLLEVMPSAQAVVTALLEEAGGNLG